MKPEPENSAPELNLLHTFLAVGADDVAGRAAYRLSSGDIEALDAFLQRAAPVLSGGWKTGAPLPPIPEKDFAEALRLAATCDAAAAFLTSRMLAGIASEKN